MKNIKSYIFENSKDTTALKQKLIDLLTHADLDNEDLIKMYNIGKYSDKVLGYKAYDAEHATTKLKTSARGKQVYKYTLKNTSNGETVEVVTSSDYPWGNGVSKKTYDEIVSKEEVTFQQADPLYYDTPFKRRLANININDASQKNLIRLLRDINMIDRYCSYIESPTMTVNDIISGGNIFNICEKNTRLNRNALRSLATFQSKDLRGTTLGNYEILLKLLLSDYNNTTRLDGKGGDIIAGGIAIEIKGRGGRLSGQNPGDPVKLNESFYNFFRSKNPSAFKVFSESCIELLKERAKRKSENSDGEKEEIKVTIDNPFVNPVKVGVVVECLINAGYSKEDIAGATAAAMNAFYGDGDGSIIETMILKHWDDILKNPILIHRIIGCYQVIKYQKSEKWDYLALFDERKINGDYIMISKDQLSIEYLYNLRSVIFDKGIAMKSSRDGALGISYRK